MGILTALFILAISSIITTMVYLQKWAKRKVFHELLEIRQILVLGILTIVFTTFFMNAFFDIITQTNVHKVPISDMIVLNMLTIFLGSGVLGNGIHFTGKVLSYNLKHSKDRWVRKNSYFFHISLGHNLIYLFTWLASVLLSILEVNHPSSVISQGTLGIVVLFGLIWGVSWTFTIAVSLVDKRIYIILGSMSSVVLILMANILNLEILQLPYGIFFFITIVVTTLLLISIKIIERVTNKPFAVLMSSRAQVELSKSYFKEKLD